MRKTLWKVKSSCIGSKIEQSFKKFKVAEEIPQRVVFLHISVTAVGPSVVKALWQYDLGIISIALETKLKLVANHFD